MYTINDLRKILGLSTANQVRNRIEAVKDLLAGHLRRGPNNQILLTEEGLKILKRLQDLYDSGLTIMQASEVLRSNAEYQRTRKPELLPAFTTNRADPSASEALIAALKEEIAFLRARIAFLEEQLHVQGNESPRRSWWEALKEEIDGT